MCADSDNDAIEEQDYLLPRDRMVLQLNAAMMSQSNAELGAAQDELNVLHKMKASGFSHRHPTLYRAYVARTRALFADANGTFDEP